MKLLTIQSHAGGPWRWAIVDDTNVVMAKCREPYRKEGMALLAARNFIRRAAESPHESRPSVQLDLFDNERLGGVERSRRAA